MTIDQTVLARLRTVPQRHQRFVDEAPHRSPHHWMWWMRCRRLLARLMPSGEVMPIGTGAGGGQLAPSTTGAIVGNGTNQGREVRRRNSPSPPPVSP
jgi:hypothetical protein